MSVRFADGGEFGEEIDGVKVVLATPDGEEVVFVSIGGIT